MIRQLLMQQKDEKRIAIYESGQQIPYYILKEKAIAVQARLQSKQIGNVAVFLPDGADYIAAFFGTLMAGMTVFPLSILLTGHEIAPLLEQASVHTVITSRLFYPVIAQSFGALGQERQIICINELPSVGSETVKQREIPGKGEPMVLLATSGTTGRAKIVQLSERNVECSVRGYLDKMDYQNIPEQAIRYILGTPYSAAYGLMLVIACMMNSFPIVVLPPPFTLDLFYQTVETCRVTHYEGSTSIALLMARMAGRPNPFDISSLRYMGVGGSKVSEEIMRVMITAYPWLECWTGYGMTEASPLISKFDKKLNTSKLESVGTAIQGMTIMVEADGQITDTPGITGEIIVKGPSVMIGYYQNEEETKKIIKNGYLYTGDIGYLDEDKYLFICGRKKNVIMARGFSVYPEEVEASILTSELVKACIVYGEPDPSGTEIVCANVVPAAVTISAKQIHAYCKEHLAEYKQPRRIRIVDSIEQTATTKIKRTVTDNR